MKKNKIPIRPESNFFSLEENEKDCITWMILSGCSREEAYKRFIRPDLGASPKVLTRNAEQFFSAAEVRDYAKEYEYILKLFLGGVFNKSNGTSYRQPQKEELEASTKSIEERKTAAVSKFKNQVLDMMMNDIDTIEKMDSIAKIADKVNILDDSVQEEKPRRYLPELCYKSCRYRLFVESAVKDGTIEDECQYCKALAYAKGNGYTDDNTTRLNINNESN